ncbi:MAG: zinc ABC transporter substrate-binding protein [Phycisphaerales bacterium]|nr:zinc ABC transporter substrate-binding protein [Phycisphaerales bacterium]
MHHRRHHRRHHGRVARCLHALTLAFGAALAGCGPGATPEPGGAGGDQAGPYTIATTVGMISDIAQEVAGDRATVGGLIGPGVDPHLYRPTRTDVQKLLDADVVLYNGLLLEGKMTDSLIRAANAGKRVHAVTELMDEQYLLEPAEFAGHHDPHVWMDPAAWAKAVEVVRDRLSEYDPEGAAAYSANAGAYLTQLGALDAYAAGVLATVPEGQRVLVTAHDAFNYFGRRFGFEVVGIQGLSTESEAGVRDIERLVDLLVERKVGAVFVESTVSERNINALIAGAKARGHTVVIGGELFSDAMGDAGTYEGTYIGMIDHNVTTIARALGGQAPDRGMQGRLSP